MAHDPRTREVPENLRALVADCLERRGASGAAKAIGIGRNTVLAIAAGQPVLPGSLALLREYERRCEMASAKATQLAGTIANADCRPWGMRGRK